MAHPIYRFFPPTLTGGMDWGPPPDPQLWPVPGCTLQAFGSEPMDDSFPLSLCLLSLLINCSK